MAFSFDDIKLGTYHLDPRKAQIAEVHAKYNKMRAAHSASPSERLELLLDLLEVAKTECNFADYPKAEFYLKKYHDLDKKFNLRTLKSPDGILNITEHAITRWNEKIDETCDIFYAMARQEMQNSCYAKALNVLEMRKRLDPKQKSAESLRKQITKAMQKADDKRDDHHVSLLTISMSKCGVISVPAARSPTSKATLKPSAAPLTDLVEVSLESPPHRPATPTPDG